LWARETPGASGGDIRLSLALDLTYVTVDSKYIDSCFADVLPLPIAKAEQGLLSQTLAAWQPNSLGEYLAAIDHPQLLRGIADSVEEVIAANQYRRDLLLFLPRFLADFATVGAASAIEMVYKIYRRNRNEPTS